MDLDSLTPSFRVYFNRKRQYINVYLYDVHPTTFANWKFGRWGMFDPKWTNPKDGYFGDIHLVESRVRDDLIVHELAHAWIEWIWANRTAVTSRNEETMVAMLDELVRKFGREYRKYMEKK